MFAVVYGTLKKGESNNRLLSGSSLVTTCVVRGFKLYNSGFPVAQKNPLTCITGEVWNIGDPSSQIEEEAKKAKWTLRNLDSLEGYYEDALERSMYHRVPVTAYGDDGLTYEAQMYVGNEDYWRGFRGLNECSYDESSNAYTWGGYRG